MISVADGVWEGGGTRGAGHVGALSVFEERGTRFERVAGTSAGAIIAAMVACGIGAKTILDVMMRVEFAKFRDWRPLLIAWDLWARLGVCRGDAFEKWLRSVIGDVTLGATKIPLTVVTSDLANNEIVTLSSSSHPSLPVARAVRMSMSIPFMFQPVAFDDHGVKRLCVDGGIADNFPIELFDVHDVPRWPTIGFLLAETEQGPASIHNPIGQALRLVSFMRGAPQRKLTEHNAFRTVCIPDSGISWVDFTLSRDQKFELYLNGREAAEKFLDRWDTNGGMDGYVRAFRSADAPVSQTNITGRGAATPNGTASRRQAPQNTSSVPVT